MNTRSGSERQPGSRIGLSLAADVAGWGFLPGARLIDQIGALRIDTLEVHAGVLERVLGAPVPTVPLDPLPADGLSLGLLDLEEDVLRDSYDLAKDTFDTQLRAWRRAAPLTPLGLLRASWQTAGIAIDIVSVPDLIRWSDDEVNYVCRVARAVGARVIATPLSLAGPRRLAPFAAAHDLLVSFSNDASAGPTEFRDALEYGSNVAVALDVGTWTRGDYGPPVDLLREYPTRVSHVRLQDIRRSDGAAVPFGEGDAGIRDVVHAIDENGWRFPAIVVIDALGPDDTWITAAAQAVSYCRSRA